MVIHNINTGNANPIKQHPYKASPDQQVFIKREIEKMLYQGIISPITSPWSFPVVIVSKKNGKQRFCVDYRKLNSVTEKDVYPMPVVDDLLETFNGAQWFTCLDLVSEYCQVAMTDQDKSKTAFTTKYGLYEFNVMPFGLCNAPAIFQRLMDKVLAPYRGKFVEVYLDDITIFSATFELHCEHVSVILEVLGQASLMLNADKYYFFLSKVKLLDHMISKEGIQPDNNKIVKVKEFSKPTTLRQLRGFFELASYYRKFIKNFFTVV